MKKVINLLEGRNEGYELYTFEGAKLGDKAVLVNYNLSTGSELGVHGWIDSFAEAQVGTLGEDMDFVADTYTVEDAPNRASINRPKEIEGWNPRQDDETVDWEVYTEWVENYCQQVL